MDHLVERKGAATREVQHRTGQSRPPPGGGAEEGVVEAPRVSGLRHDPDLQAELLRRSTRRSHRERRPGRRGGRERWKRLGLLRVHRAGDTGTTGRLAGGDAGRLRDRLVPSTDLGSSRGRSGPWWPSRSAHRAARCCCAAPSAAGCSARRTGARRSITGGSSTPTIRRAAGERVVGPRAGAAARLPEHHVQREYRFAVWADGKTRRDRVDLKESPALLDAMQRSPRERGVVVPASGDESAAVKEVNRPGLSGGRVFVEAPLAIPRPTIVPPRYFAEGLPGELRETAAVHAAVEALRAAVDQVDAEPRRDAVAAAWHAESVVRFFCSTYGSSIAGVRVNEEGFIVITADVSGDEPVGGDDRGRTGRHVRVQGLHCRRPPRVGCTRRVRFRAGPDKPAGGVRSARSGLR